jgi:PIN domain nuclease of toxin-antitoxin system
MRYLLDTHTLIWALEDNPNLPESVRDIITNENNDIFVSGVSIWEISIKHKKNPNSLPYSGKEIVHFSQRAGYRFLSVSIEDVLTVEDFDHKDHKDPFDIMLISQCINAKMRIITHDSMLKEINEKAVLHF